MSKKKKKKKKLWVRILLYFLLVCFIAILAIGTKLALDAKDMYEKAKIAKADAEQALSMFEVKEYAKAKKHINNIQTTLKDYINTLSTPLWNLGSYVPKYGHDFDLGRDMLALADKALDENVDDVFDMLENYPLDQIATDDGYNVDIILNYLNFAEEKVPVAKSYLDEVRSANFVIDQEGLLQKYVGKADELLALYDKAYKYFPLIKVILGNGEDRLYLLEAQNSAEIRSSGGFPGSMGLIRIKDHLLTIGDFSTPYQYLTYETPAAANISWVEEKLFGGWVDAPRDCCFIPDFERSAYPIALGYEYRKGEKLDGIISLTPIIIQDILDVVGPVELSDGTVLDGSNATRVLQYDLYMKYFSEEALRKSSSQEENDVSDELFSESAMLSMAALFDNISLDTIEPLLDVFEKNVEKRVIQIWMADEEEENIVRELDCSGCLNDDANNPEIGVYYTLCDPSKLGWFLTEDIDIQKSAVLEDGRIQYDVTVTLNNRVSNYYYNHASYWIIGNYNGNIAGGIYIFAPEGGEISEAYTDYGVYMNYENYLGHELAYCRLFIIYRNDPITIHCKVTTAAGVTTPLGYNTNPLLQDYWTEEDLAKLD